MIGEENEKQDETTQLAAKSVETKHKKNTPLRGETRWGTISNICK